MWVLYQTTNLINDKIYIGIHNEEDLNNPDDYLGCGVYRNRRNGCIATTPFQKAVKKYGEQNFERKILKICDSEEEAKQLESEIVNEEFIKSNTNYNITPGGQVPPLLTKNIYQYSIDGEYIATWKSIKSITDYFEVNKNRIRMCMNTKRSFANSYWSEDYIEKLDTTEYRPSARSFIREYDLNGNLIKIYSGGKKLTKELGIKYSSTEICNRIYKNRCYLTDGVKFEDVINNKSSKNLLIYQYDLNYNLVNKFNNLSEAHKITGFNKLDITRAAKLNSNYNNYYWSYELIDDINKFNTNNIKIGQYDLNDNLIKIWDDILECQKEYPSVMQVLLGNRIHCKKFIFKYIN